MVTNIGVIDLGIMFVVQRRVESGGGARDMEAVYLRRFLVENL